MSDGADLIYHYDGTFDGLLCCVFESYAQKEIPLDILSPLSAQTTLFPVKEIATDEEKARRVLLSIPKKMGADALEFVRTGFLSCHGQRELLLLRFLRKGYESGPRVMDMLADDAVAPLFSAVQHVTREAHLLKGFIRFSDFHGALVSQIEPKNWVLPLLTQHFCERYPEERFLIYDKTHGMALSYRPHRPRILPVEALELSQPDETEEAYRELWRLFYRTIEVQGRHNPRCRMSHMPKRYWDNMTEFGRPVAFAGNIPTALPQSSGRRLPLPDHSKK